MNVRDLASITSPGLIFIDYNYWNNSNGYYDKNGNKVTGIQVQDKLLNLDINVSGYINVPVLFYTSKFKLLGGRYSVSIAPTLISSNYKANIHTDNNEVYTKGNTSGFGDMAFSPLNLSWTKDKMDFSFIYTAYAPTGKYETGADDNIGKGYWTHQLQVPFYYYLMEKATALFVMPTYEMNGEIKDSSVRPGSRFTIEYGISQYVNSWLEFEVINGHNWQIGNDTGEGIWWKDSQLFDKDQTSTVSFGAGAWPIIEKLNIRAKYALDYGTKQRFKSNFLSLSVIFIPNILTGKRNTEAVSE